MSALPPIADLCAATRYVRFVPVADNSQRTRHVRFTPKAELVGPLLRRMQSLQHKLAPPRRADGRKITFSSKAWLT